MWTCKKCGESSEDQFDSCWKCSASKAWVAPNVPANSTEPPAAPVIVKQRRRLAYKYFRGTLATWDELFGEAAQFATGIGSEQVVNISHSADESDGVVTVWYWTDADETGGP